MIQMIKRLVIAALLAASGLTMAETGVSDSRIVIGMSGPFSGPNGEYGIEMRQTILAYFDQINKSGGIHGRKLELVALDDGYETDRTVANTKALISEKGVFALLAYYGSSPTTEAMNKVFGPAKVPLVGTISGAGTLREPLAKNPNGRYMFNVRASYADETAAIVNQLVSLGIRKIAVFYQNDGFGKSGLEGTTAALKKHGLVPSSVATVERNSVDVAKAVEIIAKDTPQAVLMVTLVKPTAAFVKAMLKTPQRPTLMTLSPVGTEQLVAELGPDSRGVGISQVMPYPWNDTVPMVRDYQKLAPKKNAYSYYGIEGYAMARVLVEGIRKAGPKDLTREKLVTALEATNVDLGGFRVAFDSSQRSGSSFVELTVLGPGGKVLK
ncbi:MAG: ABC transporter substrate-binding protein [Betaproteobacteria bacterium]|nr:ABC transporter substrate-binding protein [Betaproteobacteria bacterium]